MVWSKKIDKQYWVVWTNKDGAVKIVQRQNTPNKEKWLFEKNDSSNNYESKSFKTKSQALAFAKAYMRNH